MQRSKKPSGILRLDVEASEASESTEKLLSVNVERSWTAMGASRDEGTTSLAISWLYPALLALSLCHCKNVELQPEDLPQALRRAREKRGRAAVSRFYTLEISSMRRDLEAAGSVSSLRNALHLCRGHFKDYREGGGLFGKHHGLYWWDLQARGTSTRGEVRKDYSIGSEEKPTGGRE